MVVIKKKLEAKVEGWIWWWILLLVWKA